MLTIFSSLLRFFRPAEPSGRRVFLVLLPGIPPRVGNVPGLGKGVPQRFVRGGLVDDGPACDLFTLGTSHIAGGVFVMGTQDESGAYFTWATRSAITPQGSAA